MKIAKKYFFAILTFSLFIPRGHAGNPSKRIPDQVLLVVNLNSAVSKSIADDYAHKRKVTNLVSVRCRDSALNAKNETMTLADYAQFVEKPIHEYLAAHANIDFIVLTKGIPIRITGAAMGSCDEHSHEPVATRGHPSVDSYLAASDYTNLIATEVVGANLFAAARNAQTATRITREFILQERLTLRASGQLP